MRLHIRRFAEFSIILVISSFAMEKISDRALRNNYDLKASLVSSGDINADILVQGPSRVLYGLNPEIVTEKTGNSCYNMGTNNSHIQEQLLFLKLYLAHNKKPKALFIEYAYDYLDRNALMFHPYYFVPYLDNDAVRDSVEKHDERLIALSHFPLLKYSLYNGKLMNEVARGFIQTLSGSREIHTLRGYQPGRSQWDGTFEEFMRDNPSGKTLDIDRGRLLHVKEYIRFVREEGIPIYAYESPILDDALSVTLNHQEAKDILTDFFRSEGVLYKRFDTLPIGSKREYFYNPGHLTPVGADLFSSAFADFVGEVVE